MIFKYENVKMKKCVNSKMTATLISTLTLHFRPKYNFRSIANVSLHSNFVSAILFRNK